jgi:hypothetical protein
VPATKAKSKEARERAKQPSVQASRERQDKQKNKTKTKGASRGVERPGVKKASQTAICPTTHESEKISRTTAPKAKPQAEELSTQG